MRRVAIYPRKPGHQNMGRVLVARRDVDGYESSLMIMEKSLRTRISMTGLKKL